LLFFSVLFVFSVSKLTFVSASCSAFIGCAGLWFLNLSFFISLGLLPCIGFR
jgi:hypothetical protein